VAESDDDRRALTAYAEALADGIDAALAPWVERSVLERWGAWSGARPDDAVRARAAAAGAEAAAVVVPRVRELLALDIDEQRTGPLDVVRSAVPMATAALAELGVPPSERDEFAERMFPDDVYDLIPGSFAELDPTLLEAGIAWGAAKAHVHLARRR
jgi:hypothetical protein